jgi:hypothetical protein
MPAAGVDQKPRECEAVAVGVKRLAAVPQDGCHPLEVIQQRELPRRVVPFARVALDPCRERGQGLDVRLVFPPARPDG